jgi:hypothetical protein
MPADAGTLQKRGRVRQRALHRHAQGHCMNVPEERRDLGMEARIERPNRNIRALLRDWFSLRWGRTARTTSPATATTDCDLILVCGPSSCGKSTYIERAIAAGQLPRDSAVCMGYDYVKMEALAGPIVMHYNTLRPIDQELEKLRAGQPNRYGTLLRRLDFKIDPAWLAILGHKGTKRAVVPVARESTLWRRAADRRLIEPGLTGTQPYPSDHWLSHYRRIDLSSHYLQVVAELERELIPYQMVDAELDGYPPVSSLADVFTASNEIASTIG